jgi:hypothetical protein
MLKKFNLLEDYKRNLPFVFIEGNYENERASEVCLRSQIYWPVLLGATGYFFATKPVWGFDLNWQNYLNTQGSADLKRASDFWETLPWYELVPDVNHQLLISGYGNLSDGTYATAALSKNGKYLAVYTPDQRELTINLKELNFKKIYCKWIQPSTGKIFQDEMDNKDLIRKFTPPEPGDWLLVLSKTKK